MDMIIAMVYCIIALFIHFPIIIKASLFFFALPITPCTFNSMQQKIFVFMSIVQIEIFTIITIQLLHSTPAS